MDTLLDQLKFDSAGLVPAIVQDEQGEVLALYYMNREAIRKTIQTRRVHTYSRSRKRLALKGETSGHFEHVKSLRADCDKDALLIRVEQTGGACHEGYYSCFYNELDDGGSQWKIVGRKVFDPKVVYQKS
jgi:phosphoribosyl-ATP pyrophosphohydrolase/phosphoribosyl-AMP cyclohydrolase